MDISGQDTLFDVLNKKSFRMGKFTLASGKESDVYMDVKTAQMDQEGCFWMGEVIRQKMEDLPAVDSIGGLAVGAVSVVTSVLLSFRAAGKDMRGFWVRERKKQHGTQCSVEGLLEDGDRVVILDDVITTGDSVMKAIDEAEAAGATVLRVISLVDRDEGGKEQLAERGYDYQPLFHIGEFRDKAQQAHQTA